MWWTKTHSQLCQRSEEGCGELMLTVHYVRGLRKGVVNWHSQSIMSEVWGRMWWTDAHSPLCQRSEEGCGEPTLTGNYVKGQRKDVVNWCSRSIMSKVRGRMWWTDALTQLCQSSEEGYGKPMLGAWAVTCCCSPAAMACSSAGLVSMVCEEMIWPVLVTSCGCVSRMGAWELSSCGWPGMGMAMDWPLDCTHRFNRPVSQRSRYSFSNRCDRSIRLVKSGSWKLVG